MIVTALQLLRRIKALLGGAIAFSPHSPNQPQEGTDYTLEHSANSTFSHEPVAQLGAAIHTEVNPFYVFGTINSVAIRDCIFENNSILYEREKPNFKSCHGYRYRVHVSSPSKFLIQCEIL